MFSELMQKEPLNGKKGEEAIRQFLYERHWSDNLMWHGKSHESCKAKHPGSWRGTNFGFYQSADWQWRWFLGYRCSTCGTLVQFSQIADADNASEHPVIRNVWLR